MTILLMIVAWLALALVLALAFGALIEAGKGPGPLVTSTEAADAPPAREQEDAPTLGGPYAPEHERLVA